MKPVILLISCVTATICANVQPRDVFSEAEVTLETYRNTVTTLLLKASAQFTETNEYLKAHGQAVFRVGARLIINAQQGFMRELEELERYVLEHNRDPLECLRYPMQQIGYLPKGLLNSLERCTRIRTDELEFDLKLAFSKFNDLNETVQDYSNRIEECRLSNDEVCVMLVTSQMSLQIDMLPIMLEAEIQEVVNQFANLDLYFQDCFSSPTQEAVRAGTSVVQTARDCVDLMINGSKAV